MIGSAQEGGALTTELDLAFVRRQFPASEEPSLEGFAHFENAGGSYACCQAIEWLDRYYRQTKVQPYYGFPASRLAGEQMDDARQRMAAWLNVGAGQPTPQTLSMLDLSHPDLGSVSLAQGMGVPATRAASAEEFDAQFAEAMAGGGPRLIEAIVVQQMP